jgi:hypothetical protein
MNTFTPSPDFNYYYKACRKGDLEAKAVAVSQSPVGVLADASEVSGLPRDNFEVHEISKAEFETFDLRNQFRHVSQAWIVSPGSPVTD